MKIEEYKTAVGDSAPELENGSSLFSVEWFSWKFLALEARMKAAGGKLGETKRTHRIAC